MRRSSSAPSLRIRRVANETWPPLRDALEHRVVLGLQLVRDERRLQAHDLGRGPAEQPLGGRVPHGDGPVGAERDDRVGGALDDRPRGRVARPIAAPVSACHRQPQPHGLMLPPSRLQRKTRREGVDGTLWRVNRDGTEPAAPIRVQVDMKLATRSWVRGPRLGSSPPTASSRVCGTAAIAACGTTPAPGTGAAAKPKVSLHVTELSTTGKATKHWTLSCDPAGGTHPHADGRVPGAAGDQEPLRPARRGHQLPDDPGQRAAGHRLRHLVRQARDSTIIADGGCTLGPGTSSARSCSDP